MSGATYVVTRKNEYDQVGTSPFRVQIVAAVHTWFGYVPQVLLLKLKTRTTCLTDVSPLRAKSGRMLTVRKVGTFDLLSEEAIKKAFVAKQNIAMTYIEE